MQLPFADRRDAGKRLATHLATYASSKDSIVLGLPRGGVPVAYEVAVGLHLPLDVFVVRKLGVPGHEELAFGAVASGGVRVLNQDLIRTESIASMLIDAIADRELAELSRRDELYRGDTSAPQVAGRSALVVDDGLATGASMMAAVRALRALGAAKVVVAVPVGPESVVELFANEADEVVCPYTPTPFRAVSLWYEDFRPTTDAEVQACLVRSARRYAQES